MVVKLYIVKYYPVYEFILNINILILKHFY